jgi:hypothetical protein
MRIGILLCALLISIAPAFAIRDSHSSSIRSNSSHSYHPRSSGSHRSHSSTGRTYRTRSTYSGQRYRARSSRTPTYGVQRDSDGRIKRSAAAKNAFKRQHPCPSTGRSTGGCPGYVVDHVRASECGGPDSSSNMRWQTVAAGKAKDKTERNCR